jgi:hypothetical protein
VEPEHWLDRPASSRRANIGHPLAQVISKDVSNYSVPVTIKAMPIETKNIYTVVQDHQDRRTIYATPGSREDGSRCSTEGKCVKNGTYICGLFKPKIRGSMHVSIVVPSTFSPRNSQDERTEIPDTLILKIQVQPVQPVNDGRRFGKVGSKSGSRAFSA